MFNKVIFPVDLQDLDQLEPYIEQAQAFVRHTGAELRLVTVLPGYSMPIVASYFPAQALEKLKKEAGATLANFIQAHLYPQLKVSYQVREGRIHEEIIAEAKAWPADLVLLPSRVRPGLTSHLGSVAQRVTERATCSVLVLRLPTSD